MGSQITNHSRCDLLSALLNLPFHLESVLWSHNVAANTFHEALERKECFKLCLKERGSW